ncbi:MAG TPA: hypothetical protein VMU84_07430 [Thermoanaerobaculia bacterium]|nr:hypothetical protein [Thermoanaerobaculia bacterium]
MFKNLIFLAGLVQLAIALSSLAIPYVLGWREELRALRPLTRSVFWTYAGYTFGIHLWFAAVSIVAPGALAAGGILATFITGFIALYWAVRVVAQFTWYDRSVAGDRLLFRFAEVAYVLAFAALAIIYGTVALR